MATLLVVVIAGGITQTYTIPITVTRPRGRFRLSAVRVGAPAGHTTWTGSQWK